DRRPREPVRFRHRTDHGRAVGRRRLDPCELPDGAPEAVEVPCRPLPKVVVRGEPKSMARLEVVEIPADASPTSNVARRLPQNFRLHHATDTGTDKTPRPITPPPHRTESVNSSFGKRSNMRRNAMRVSSRASAAPRQWCSPHPKPKCGLGS